MSCPERLEVLRRNLADSTGKGRAKLARENSEIADHLSKTYPDLPQRDAIKLFIWGIDKQPSCNNCGGACGPTSTRGVVRKFCSNRCSAEWKKANGVYDVIQEKIRQTNLERTGYNHHWESPEIRAKIKRTNVENLGVENPFANKKIQDKIRQTNIEKYGVENPAQSDKVQQKIRQTNLNRYGCKVAVAGNPESISKGRSTSLRNHGVESYLMLPEVNKAGRDAQIDDDGKHWSQQHISDAAIEILSDPDRLLSHITESGSLVRSANAMGIAASTLGRYASGFGIKLDRSYPETAIAAFLDQYGVDYLKGRRDIVPPVELDFYIPDYALAIEFCGLYWHSEVGGGKGPDYHVGKHDKCLEQGIQLITIFEDEWNNNSDLIKRRILHKLGIGARAIGARKTTVVDVERNQYRDFCNLHHIQGADKSSSLLRGLEYDGELVAVAGIGRRRISRGVQSNSELELIRFCTNRHVPGAMGKLLSNVECDLMITYADRRWNTGNSYLNVGFKHDGTSPPSYWYLIHYKKRLHRFSRRKSVLVEKFGGDPNLTEWQNAQMLGLDRIWDCGSERYVR